MLTTAKNCLQVSSRVAQLFQRGAHVRATRGLTRRILGEWYPTRKPRHRCVDTLNRAGHGTPPLPDPLLSGHVLRDHPRGFGNPPVQRQFAQGLQPDDISLAGSGALQDGRLHAWPALERRRPCPAALGTPTLGSPRRRSQHTVPSRSVLPNAEYAVRELRVVDHAPALVPRRSASRAEETSAREQQRRLQWRDRDRLLSNSPSPL